MSELRNYDVACTLGLEGVLAGELQALGASDVAPRRGGVVCRGDVALGYRACLWLRSAVRVLEQLASFDVETERDLYDQVYGLPWETWLSPDDTLAVAASVRDSVLTHSSYAALRVKDAVVDRFRDRAGRRPDVDREHPSMWLRLRLAKGKASLARDLSGESLHKRGYHPLRGKSPLNEATAAGLLLLAGYDGTGLLVDPMCGSATFLIEAAWIAMDRAPGLDRRFAFTGWAGFARELWHEIVADALDRTREQVPARFLGLDSHEGALSIARASVAAASVAPLVQLEQGDAATWRPPAPPRWVFTNPPWGERLGPDVDASWQALAAFARGCPGADLHVLSGSPELTGRLRLKASRRWPVRSGAIDCRLLHYPISAARGARSA